MCLSVYYIGVKGSSRFKFTDCNGASFSPTFVVSTKNVVKIIQTPHQLVLIGCMKLPPVCPTPYFN